MSFFSELIGIEALGLWVFFRGIFTAKDAKDTEVRSNLVRSWWFVVVEPLRGAVAAGGRDEGPNVLHSKLK